jgi:hypothetical protein
MRRIPNRIARNLCVGNPALRFTEVGFVLSLVGYVDVSSILEAWHHHHTRSRREGLMDV